jgi:uncharacterized membrane protein
MGTGSGSGAYKFVLVLHLMAVIIGFGGVVIAGIFGTKGAMRGGHDGQVLGETTMDVVENWAMWFIYAVPVLGIILIFLSEDVWDFSQTWISLSLLLYIVALGVVHAAHLPNLRKLNALVAELGAGGAPPGGAGGGPPPQLAELKRRGQLAGILGGVVNLLWVVIVFLMVWKPGFP